jgi:hypothetical protein
MAARCASPTITLEQSLVLSKFGRPSQGSEIRGATDRPAGSAYLLLEGARPTHIKASEESVKFILRMTGAGPL